MSTTGIYQRPDSPYWWAAWKDASGKTVRRSTRVAVADDPRGRQAATVREQWARPPAMEPRLTEATGGTWDELIELYLEHLATTCRRGTLRRYEAALRALYPVFTGKRVAGITRADVKTYLRERRANCQAATVNIEISLMSGAWAWAMEELEWELDNPWRQRRQRVNEPRRRWLTRAECDRLIQAAADLPYLRDYIVIALNTGLRPGELLALRWERVDLERGLIRFDGADSKSGRAASIPINATARLALLTRREAQTARHLVTPWVITRHDGQRLQSVRNGLASACQRAGLKDVHPHDLRRTFASHLVQAGVSIQAVSGLLRHADIGITHRVYAHLSPEQYRSATALLDAPPRLRAV